MHALSVRAPELAVPAAEAVQPLVFEVENVGANGVEEVGVVRDH